MAPNVGNHIIMLLPQTKGDCGPGLLAWLSLVDLPVVWLCSLALCKVRPPVLAPASSPRCLESCPLEGGACPTDAGQMWGQAGRRVTSSGKRTANHGL